MDKSVEFSQDSESVLREGIPLIKLGKILSLGGRFYLKIAELYSLIYLSFPNRVQCNICGWQGRRFRSDSWHPYSMCPKCYSQIRHRLLIAALTRPHSDFSLANIVKNKKVLHFAPEQLIGSLIRRNTDQYRTADLYQEGCDLRLDIASMPEVQSWEFDLLIACDVLEHVSDDRAAMREIYRILRPGGWAILTVPQKDNLDKTFEDKSIAGPQERERAFGQSDHLRIYGDDFPQFLEQAGFRVNIITEKNFPPDLVKKFVLFPPVLSDKPMATNYRKIFFARKVVAE